MKRETFTDFDAFRASNPQIDSEWLINGGRDWRWNVESLTLGHCGVLPCYTHTGLIIESLEAMDYYHFYVPFKSGVCHINGVSAIQERLFNFS